jgi:hypothetical protein
LHPYTPPAKYRGCIYRIRKEEDIYIPQLEKGKRTDSIIRKVLEI